MGFTVEQSEKRGERSITTRFTITDPEYVRPSGYADEGDYRPALDVVTSHDKDRKRYTTYIHRVLVSPRIVRWAMELRQDDECPITNAVAVSVPRYSARGLEDRHASIMKDLTEILAQSGMRDAVLEWVTRAKS